jgi:NADH-quinone oxidoreductase subunit L
MYFLIVVIPLIVFIFLSILGFYFGREGAIILSIFGQILTFIFVIISFYEVVLCLSPVYLNLWTWLTIDIYTISFNLYFDSLTCFMLFIISLISLSVQLYSVGYMENDPHITRFFSFLSLFTFFMLVLVTADNFLQLFIGWEGVGVCSFLLISFWYTRILAVKAAVKAMLMNRIADVFFLLAIILIFLYFKTLNFIIVFNLVTFILNEQIFFLWFFVKKIDLICFFLFIGAIGKSAQIGLHTWLPDAMEGPTPVSALLHAATMVTAGIFLIIRCSFLFEYSEIVLSLICLFGG